MPIQSQNARALISKDSALTCLSLIPTFFTLIGARRQGTTRAAKLKRMGKLGPGPPRKVERRSRYAGCLQMGFGAGDRACKPEADFLPATHTVCSDLHVLGNDLENKSAIK